jgi:RND family efflux transporter MFP subunit
MTRRWLAILLAAVLVAGCTKPPPAAEPERAVRTLVVSAGLAGRSVEFAADVQARVEANLGFRVGGKLIRRAVGLGDQVLAGQVLAELDASDLALGQAAAQAAVRSAQANYAQSKSDYARFTDLQRQGFISAADLERRESTLKSARALLEQAQVQARVEANQTGYGTLRADAAGVVTAVDVDAGTVVAAGTPIVRLAHDGPRDAVFAVPEDAVESLRRLLGQPGALEVRLWGDAQPTFKVTLREVSAAADPVTRTFLAKADLGPAKVHLGQTATVLLPRPALQGVARLPLSAVVQQRGNPSVWLVDRRSMQVRLQPVQLGGADGNTLIVLGGLSPGDVVVTAGVHMLSVGQKVKFYQGAP